MAPRLSVTAGPSPDSLSAVAVNHDDIPFVVASRHFVGRIAVRIKDFTGEDPAGVDHRESSPYFDAGPGTNGHGMTWSIVIQGRFLPSSDSEDGSYSADDIVFGNFFDRPIRDSLPWGTSAAVQFAKVIDPSLTCDLYADKPWAVSPLVATMQRLNVTRLPGTAATSDVSGDAQHEFAKGGWPAFPSTEAGWTAETDVEDNVTPLFYIASDDGDEDELDPTTGVSPAKLPDFTSPPRPHDVRRSHFSSAERRSSVRITPRDVVTCDFMNGFVNFSDLSLGIPFSGGMSFDLRRYWDGQPVRYECKTRDGSKTFFVIQFDITDAEGRATVRGRDVK